MPRKPLSAAPAIDAEANHAAIAQAGAAATELVILEEQNEANLQALSDALNYEGPLSIDSLEEGIRFYQKRTVEACLELGKRLLLLKAMAGHGEFAERVDTLGIDRRLSQRLMSAAFKFAKSGKSPLLQAAGNQSKFLELVVLDDEEIELLSAGGNVGDITLDKIASMSTTELRKALREAQETDAAKQKLLNEKNTQIDDLKTKVKRTYKPKNGDPAQTEADRAALDELTEATNAAEVHFARLAIVVEELQGHQAAAMRERGLQAIQYLVTRMRDLVVASAIEVTLNDETLCGRPEFLDNGS